jgi:uncharacterized membrane-anchored protein
MNEQKLREIEETAKERGIDTALALVAEVRRLQAALEWYADKSHYYNGVPRYYQSGADAVARLVTDNGSTARAALTLRKGAE